MHLMFAKLFVETDADDLATDEQDQQRRAREAKRGKPAWVVRVAASHRDRPRRPRQLNRPQPLGSDAPPMVSDSGSVLARFRALARRGAPAYQAARCLLRMGERRGMPGRSRGLVSFACGDPTGLYTAIALARRHQAAAIDGDGAGAAPAPA